MTISTATQSKDMLCIDFMELRTASASGSYRVGSLASKRNAKDDDDMDVSELYMF
jgi:hypothetical protein